MIRVIVTLFLSFVGCLFIIPVLVGLLPMWTFNILVNGIGRLLSRHAVQWKDILRFETRVGWRPKSNLRTAYIDTVGDRFTVETDEDGWPGSRPIRECDVVVFGDSYAFGYGASAGCAYFVMTKRCKVKAVAAPGYNSVQALMMMKEYSEMLKGKLVVWFVYLGNDLVDNVKAHHPIFTTPFLRGGMNGEDWTIASEHVAERRWLGDAHEPNVEVLFAHLCRKSEYSIRVFSAMKYLLREGKRVCDDAGAELVVFSIPYRPQLSAEGVRKLKKHLATSDGFDPDNPDNQLSAACRGLGISFVSGGSYLGLRDYKLRDNHWNRRGNKKVAKVLDRLYDEKILRNPRITGKTTVEETENSMGLWKVTKC